MWASQRLFCDEGAGEAHGGRLRKVIWTGTGRQLIPMTNVGDPSNCHHWCALPQPLPLNLKVSRSIFDAEFKSNSCSGKKGYATRSFPSEKRHLLNHP